MRVFNGFSLSYGRALMRAMAFVCALLLATSTAAQNETSTMRFEKTNWNFGNFKEINGAVSHRFVFTNVGKVPLVIENVATTCGCTTPTFSKAPIKPGAKGYIDISYDPSGRPGQFRREITVLSGGRKNRNVLTIEGNVTERPRLITDDYPVELSNGILLEKRSVAMGIVGRGTEADPVSKTMVIPMYNNSSKSVDIVVDKSSLKSYFDVKVSPSVLKPKSKGLINVTYTPIKGDLWGMVSNEFSLIVAGVKSPVALSASAVATEDFSKMSIEEIEQAPKAQFSTQYFNFADTKKGEVLTREFTISNIGNTPLIVRDVQSGGQISSSIAAGVTIAPGDQRSFKLTLNTKNAPQGRILKSLVIILNDPNRPMREMRLAANIVN